MRNIIAGRWIGSRSGKWAVGAVLAAATVGVLPSAAKADRGDWGRANRDGRDWGRRDSDHHDWDHHDRRDHDRGSFSLRIGGPVYAPAPVVVAPPCTRVWVEPVYRTVTDRIWVPDQYQTVIDQVWVDPVTQSVTDRVWVPEQFTWGDVDHVDANGQHYSTREKVVSVPGHFEDQTRQVVVTPGHYQDVSRQVLVSAGHFEDVTRQELICAGHWEDRPVIVAAPAPVYRSGGIGINLRIPLGH